MHKKKVWKNPNPLFETNKNTVMLHVRHILNTTSDMEMETMCAYTPSKYALPHRKCVLRFCVQFTRIDIPIP